MMTMTTITVEWIYENWVIKSAQKVASKPSRIYIVLDYDTENSTSSQVDLNDLVWIIENDYKWECNEALLSKYS